MIQYVLVLSCTTGFSSDYSLLDVIRRKYSQSKNYFFNV